MRHDAFDARIVVVRRGLGARQQQLVVEDVEALVLHGAEIEGGDGDDHEDVEIVFAAVSLFVPAHGALERIHGVGDLGLVAVLDIDGERHAPAGHRHEFVLEHAEIAGDEREEIAGLRERILPDREMPPARRDRHAARDCRSIAGRVGDLRRLDARRVTREHVGAVEEIGDAAEAFRFALRAEDAFRHVEPFERGVARGRRLSDDLEREVCPARSRW